MADQPTSKVTLRTRAMVITPKDGSGPPFLIVEVEVECAGCGGFTGTIPGHHVLALAQALVAISEEHGTLVGPPMDKDRVTKEEWQGSNRAGKESVN